MSAGASGSDLDAAAEDFDAWASYLLLTSLVVPRPIAWVSTVSADGRRNLAPHSYFNVVSSEPPILHVTSSQRRGRLKDTARNIAETGEFVVNVASRGQVELVNETSAEWPPEEDEWARAGLSGLPSRRVAPERVAGAPAAMECRLVETLRIGNGTMFFGEVVWFHAAERVMDGHRVNARNLDPVARLGGPQYSPLGDIFQLSRPDWEQLRNGAPAPVISAAVVERADPAAAAPPR